MSTPNPVDQTAVHAIQSRDTLQRTHAQRHSRSQKFTPPRWLATPHSNPRPSSAASRSRAPPLTRPKPGSRYWTALAGCAHPGWRVMMYHCPCLCPSNNEPRPRPNPTPIRHRQHASGGARYTCCKGPSVPTGLPSVTVVGLDAWEPMSTHTYPVAMEPRNTILPVRSPPGAERTVTVDAILHTQQQHKAERALYRARPGKRLQTSTCTHIHALKELAALYALPVPKAGTHGSHHHGVLGP
jgi:hypothetical protein